MCRIFINKNNVPFDKDELMYSYYANPDGTGLYYYNNRTKKATVKKWEKGTDFNVIWNCVRQLHNHKHISNVNLHVRWGTAGGKTLDQCHPIHVYKDIWMMHNGVCQEFYWAPDVLSDTQCMAMWFKAVFRKLNITSIDQFNDKGIELLSQKFAYNKVVLMQSDKTLIINKELGEIGSDGIWRSWKAGAYKCIK